STHRTAEQTAVAKFWEATAPAVYWPVARSVASIPGRDVTANARLLALAGMAMDDGLIAVFDAKYAYNFWRPITAIRNGDLDGSAASVAEPGWTPLIDTPMHPEYPCAHCIVSAALGGVLEVEFAGRLLPRLTTTSPTAPGAEPPTAGAPVGGPPATGPRPRGRPGGARGGVRPAAKAAQIPPPGVAAPARPPHPPPPPPPPAATILAGAWVRSVERPALGG